jgi:hypothetical protein
MTDDGQWTAILGDIYSGKRLFWEASILGEVSSIDQSLRKTIGAPIEYSG